MNKVITACAVILTAVIVGRIMPICIPIAIGVGIGYWLWGKKEGK